MLWLPLALVCLCLVLVYTICIVPIRGVAPPQTRQPDAPATPATRVSPDDSAQQRGTKRPFDLEEVVVTGSSSKRHPPQLSHLGIDLFRFPEQQITDALDSFREMPVVETAISEIRRFQNYIAEEHQSAIQAYRNHLESIPDNSQATITTDVSILMSLQTLQAERISGALKYALGRQMSNFHMDARAYVNRQCNPKDEKVQEDIQYFINHCKDSTELIKKLEIYLREMVDIHTDQLVDLDIKFCENGVPPRGTVDRQKVDIFDEELRKAHIRQHDIITNVMKSIQERVSRLHSDQSNIPNFPPPTYDFCVSGFSQLDSASNSQMPSTPISQRDRDSGNGASQPEPRRSGRARKAIDGSKGYEEDDVRVWKTKESPSRNPDANKQRVAIQRDNPDRRQREQAADTAARQLARQESDRRQQVQAADTAARRIARRLSVADFDPEDLLTQTTRPTPDQLDGFDKCPVRAILLAYEGIDTDYYNLSAKLSTCDAEDMISESPPMHDALLQKIKKIAPTDKQQNEVIKKFKAKNSIEQSLPTCGFCGCRDYEGLSHIQKVRLFSEMGMIMKLKNGTETPPSSGASSRSATPEPEPDENVSSDTDSVIEGPSEEIEFLSNSKLYQQVRSVYKHTEEGTEEDSYFFVHPEFVTNDTDAGPMTDACDACFLSLRKGCRPKLSVACVDYGLLTRIPNLPKLTLIETLLLQPTRTYGCVFKLNCVNPNKLVNHVITFEHNAPKEVSLVTTLPRVMDIVPMIKVQFVGSKSKWEAAQNSIGAQTIFLVRANVVLQYLRILKEINPAFRDIVIQPEQDILRDISKLQTLLRNNVEIIDDENLIRLESRIGGDVTGNHSVDDVLTNQDIEHLTEFEISESFICPKDISNLSSRDTALNNIKSVDLAINGKQQESLANIQRAADPLNEITDNQTILYGTYVTLFPVKQGLLKHRKGLVDSKQVEHMMKQWHQQFANNRLIFHLFDQKRRHTCAMINARKTKNTPEASEQFQKLLSNTAFKDKLKLALLNPLGDEAKWIMRIVDPILVTQASQIEYSPAERMSLASDIIACCREHGTPSYFVTVSPDDSSNPTALRLSLRPTSNTDFPAVDNDFAGTLRCGEEEFQYSIGPGDEGRDFYLPIKRRDCVNLISAHTDASVRSYERIINSFFEDILGVQLTNQSKKTLPVQSRPMGVFGKVLAAIGVSEVQQRGCLHGHVLVWPEAPNSLYLDCAHYPTLFSALSEALDRIVTATLSGEAHIKGVIETVEKSKPKSRGPQYVCPDDVNSTEFKRLVDLDFNATQIHTHRKTFCSKNAKNDNSTCRAAKPSPPSFGTSAVELRLEDEVGVDGISKKVLRILPQVSKPAEVKFDIKDPLQRPDARIIAITLNRPLIVVTDPDGNTISEQVDYDPKDYTYQEIKVTPELRKVLLAHSIEQQKAIIAALVHRNTSIAETNKLLLVLVGSNSASYFLGAPEQSMAATFYLIKYVTKDSAAIGHTLTLVHKALEHVEKFPSTAPDSDSAVRVGMYFSQRLVNMIGSMDEYAATQAMACLLGLPANFLTMKKQYLFNWAAVAAVNATLRELDSYSKDPNHAWEDQEDALGQFAEDQEIDSTVDTDLPIGPNNLHETFISDSTYTDLEQMQRIADKFTSFGGAPIYQVGDKRIAVPQHLHYQYRSAELTFVSQYEFLKCFEVKPKPKPKTQKLSKDQSSKSIDIGAGDETPVMRRKKNGRYDFTKQHPLHETHEIFIRSKQAMPVLAGGVPPKYPSSQRPWTRAQEKEAARFAIYYLTLFSEWEEVEGVDGAFLPKHGTTWDDFCKYIDQLRSSTSYYEQAKLIRITNMAFSTELNRGKKDALSMYRYSNAARCPDYTTDHVHRLENMFLSKPLFPNSELYHPHQAIGDDESDTDDMEYLNGLIDAQDLFKSKILGEGEFGKHMTQEGQTNGLVESLNSIYEQGQRMYQELNPNKELGNHALINLAPSDMLHNRAADQLTPKQMTTHLKEHGLGEKDQIDPSTSTPPTTGQATTPIAPGTAVVDPNLALLNSEQRRIYDEFVTYANALETWRNQTASLVPGFRPALPPKPPRIFAHGGPGVGKSFMTNTIINDLNKRGEKLFKAVSFTGVASSLLIDGQTIHGSFSLDPTKILAGYETLSPMVKSNLESKWKNVSMLFIDEVSMVSADLLTAMDSRLKGIFKNDFSFGGLAVLLIGDMHQIESTSGKPLYDAMVENMEKSPISVTNKPTNSLAAQLFSTFVKVELPIQMRAKGDPNQTKLVNTIRNFQVKKPIDAECISFLKSKPLTKEDILADLLSSGPIDWMRTTVVVTSNHKCDRINHTQMRRYAKVNGLPIFKWRKDISNKKQPKNATGPLKTHELEEIYESQENMWEYFVYLAPCVMTENIRPDLKLSNGTSGFMHSLTLKTLNEVGENEREHLEADYASIQNAKSGEDITLNLRPLSINIKLHQSTTDIASWPKHLRVADDCIVIPCIDESDTSILKFVHDKDGQKRKYEIRVKSLRCSLAFARTYHKIQGATMDRIILDIHPTMYCPIRLSQLYVGLTRVRTQADIRILPLPDDNGDTWIALSKLQRKPNLEKWFNSYDSAGKWSPSIN